MKWILGFLAVLWLLSVTAEADNPTDLPRLGEQMEKAYAQLYKKISLQFRNAIHVKVRKVPNSQKVIVPVDVQILKRQLRGAVGSFVEDKLPSVLTPHTIDNLQSQFDHLVYEYCPGNITHCILEHEFLNRFHHSVHQEFTPLFHHLNLHILPKLFEKTRAQMSGILIHFNQHIMDPLHHALELKQKNLDDPWITQEMIQDFIATTRLLSPLDILLQQ
ncbi:hypothetical protein BY458DRAFT_233102 [Sporodiniella umbellata]|nr:hypothetical protein BY458DRAFT_233102 [Sporodiniella umbellata]